MRLFSVHCFRHVRLLSQVAFPSRYRIRCIVLEKHPPEDTLASRCLQCWSARLQVVLDMDGAAVRACYRCSAPSVPCAATPVLPQLPHWLAGNVRIDTLRQALNMTWDGANA